MDPITAKLMSAAGAAADPVYVDDVFSTFLYDGTGSAQTITNGIDLSGEGGLVWIKSRNNSYDHRLTDTERGLGKAIESNTADAEATTAHCVNGSFNSNGFSLSSTGTPSAVNTSGDNICSWTFRKCPGFFDVVTFTSNNSSSGVSVSHSLGSTPGMIIVKSTSDSSTDWWVWHNSSPVDSGSPPSGVPAGSRLIGRLNNSGSFTGSPNIINSVTSTSFNYGNNGAGYNDDTNTTFVAYLFAHNDGSFGEDSDEAVIKCGGYTGTGSNGLFVNLGFEPQYVLLKRTDDASNWLILDNMRGVTFGSADDIILNANQSDREVDCKFNAMEFNSTGFTLDSAGGAVNGSGATYIYIAIRRPHKPPSAGTDVFAIDTKTATAPAYTSNFPVDLMLRRNNITSTDSFEVLEKLSDILGYTNSTSVSANAGISEKFARNDGWDESSGADSNDYGFMFKRAPGFFDVVCYDGNSSSGRAMPHNLGAVPELMIIKSRDNNRAWRVYNSSIGAGGSLRLNSDAAVDSNSAYWSTPTADNIILGTDNDTNSSSYSYIALLFASLDGISKVGTYSGSSSDVTVDCGFTSGSRLVIIKRTNGSGEWFLYDSVRGLTTGIDPYVRLNSNSAQANESENWVENHNSGFKVNSTAPSDMNGSGNTYIFLAIA
jgi:hypothetical protein